MNRKPILSRSISSLLALGVLAALPSSPSARAAIDIWDGGGVGGTDLGVAANWSSDILPDVSIPDTALWNGTVAGPLSLIYSDAAFAGVPGDPGINLSIAATQTGTLNIDSSATNTNALRLGDVTIAAGAGAFSLGNGTNVFNITLGGVPGTHTWTNDSSNTAIVASDVAFGTGGAGAHTLALGGSGNWALANVITNSSGTMSLAKNGTGTLTLTGVNTYTGGLTLNAGTLLINNAAALGNTTGGALTINGGTIDNTTGAAITTTTAKAQNWNGDFTFTGSNNLNFNGGVVTLGGFGSSRTITVNAGTLTDGSFVGVGYGLTKAGPGILTVGTAVSRITGDLNVIGGTVNIGINDFVAGGLTGNGTIANGSGTVRWLFVQNNADNLFSGVLQNGGTAGLGLNKAGTGTLTLTGTNTYTHQTTAAGGTIEYGSASTPGITQTLSTVASTGLVFDRGDSAVKSSFNGTGTASLTFGARVIRTAGATGNFLINGGTNGVSNSINLTQAAGFINQGLYFSGDNYAWMNTANGFVRGIAYGTDTGAVTSGAAASLAAATHQEFTGDITGQTTATFTTLKDNGNNAFTLAGGATVTVNGILKTGNVAGGATISGGTGIQAASGAELVVRTDKANDSLTISTPILANGASSLTTSGAGTLTLGGANTYTGTTTINSNVNLSGSLTTGVVNIAGGGTLNLTGSINSANAVNGIITIGHASGGNAVLNIDGGTLRANGTSPALRIGAAGNANGFVKMTAGTLTTGSQTSVGNGNGAAGANPYAALSVSGGSFTSGSWIVVGANNDRAVLNQSGGSITVATNRITIGAGGNGSVGVTNLSGGTFTSGVGAFVGENGVGTLNVSGTAAVTLGNTQFAGNASSIAGTVTLLGGTLNTGSITKGTGTGVYRFNFNGGTLKPTASNATFFADLANTEAYVYGGNGTIDTAGFDLTIAEPMRTPTGSGLNSIAVTSGGIGYLDTPVVVVSGGSGVGAQAVANVAGGVMTGFTITSPGSGYAPGDVLSVKLFGGGATTPATTGAIAIVPNVSGGLTKSGNGTLTLAAANTYTGTTNVTGGTLLLNGSSSISGPANVTGGTLRISDFASVNGGGGMTINGSGAKLVYTSSNPLTSPVTLLNGTLDGTSSISTVTVGNGTGGVITHGDGTGSLLTIGSLTFNGAATLNLTVSSPTAEALTTTALNTNAAGLVTVNATNSSGIWSTGVYNLVSYSTLGGAGFSRFVKGTVPGLGARQFAALSNPTGFVALTIGGDLPVWTGAQNGDWTTSPIAGAKNWKLQTAGTPTDFITGDTAVFDDTATGTTAINISTANVSPTSTTFNNSALDYTVSSAGGFGIASGSLIKNGTASATLQTANTYAGGTTLNDGTLNINHSSAIGTGALTIAGGTIDNTSGSAITLSTNNAQNWNGDFAFGGTNDLNLGTGAVTLSANRVLTLNGGGKLTVGGVIGGTGFGITKSGTGTLQLAGNNTYTGATVVDNGTLIVTGGVNVPNAANVGQISVNGFGNTPVMVVQGGTINATRTAVPSFNVGNSGGGSGVLIMDGGTINSTSEFWLGDQGGSYGGMTMNAGTVNIGGWLPVSRSGSAVLNMNGGAITVSGQNLVLSSFGGANGDLNAAGGTINVTSVAANQGALIVAEAGNGLLDVSGTAAINIAGALGVNIARVAGGNGIVNLRGGTVTTPAVTKGVGNSAIFNFNGGVLRPTASSTTFLTGLTQANVFAGGAIIDTNGQNITIAQPLLAPSGNGVSSVAVDDGGLGYVHTPVVRLSGGTGTGATAIANISGGVVTGLTITNPGSGYAPDDVLFASIVGGGATTPATLGAISLAANSAAGGLTKQGNGILTLSGTNTYTGQTTITAGTLTLDATGTINSSSGITINGATAKLLQSNIAPTITPTITVTNGLLDGTGTVSSVVVSNGTGGIVTNGGGGTGVLTIGSLVFSGVGSANINTLGGVGIATTSLTTNGVGTVSLNVPLGLPWATGSTYNLISYGTFSGAINNFVAGNISGLGARQAATPVINGNNIAITIGGDSPVWTGAASGAWTTTAVGTPFNWKLQTGGTSTEFLTNDQVLFNDTATGTTSITINDATVAAAGITFNNSTKNYTISGTNGISSGLLVKNGTGSLTINTANSYAGGTTLNAGTLNINNATAIGSGPLTLNGGTIDNTSGGAITMSGNAAQFWSGDFSFGGTNNLNMGTGVATLGGSGSSRQITVNAGTVSIGSINGTAGAGYGLTKAGAGTLTVGSAISNINGDLNVAAGTLQIGASDFFATGLTGGGIVENGSGTLRWAYINNSVDKTFTGNLQNGPGAGFLGFLKRGTATQTLSGTNVLGSDLTVENGTVRITGTTSVGSGGAGFVTVGSVANQNGVLEIDGGTLNAVKNNSPSIAIGSVANSRGFLKMSSGAITTTSEFHIGRGQAGSFSAFSMSGGTVASGNWLVVGLNNDRAVLNQSGGSITVAANRLTIGAGGAGSVGVANVSGGTLTSTTGIFVGENGTGTLNISGTGVVNANDTRFNHNATSVSGTLNVFGGGTLNTAGFSGGPGFGAARLNLNGATVRATANNATFLADLTSTEATVYSGGVTIDSGAFAIRVAEPLLGAAGSGVTSIDLADGGAGYIDTPIVRLSGGIGTGATAVANVAGGVVTGFTITSPGSGYDPSDVLFATIEGGGATTPATTGNINLVANGPDGGLTKTGTGTLTIAATNTYAGATTVSAGTLEFTVSQTLGALNIGASGTVVLTASAPAPEPGAVFEDFGMQGAAFASDSGIPGAELSGASVQAVPEPGTIGLLATGLLGLFARRRRASHN